MAVFNRVRPGDTLYSSARAGGYITQVDVLEIDRLTNRARASIGLVGAAARTERWMIGSEFERLRRTRPRTAAL